MHIKCIFHAFYLQLGLHTYADMHLLACGMYNLFVLSHVLAWLYFPDSLDICFTMLFLLLYLNFIMFI